MGKKTIFTEEIFKEPNYLYKAKILRVIDGDTFTVLIDCGFETFVKTKIRLWGVDTPESRGKNKCERGTLVKSYMKEALQGKDVILSTIKKGKFGRYLGIIWIIEEDEKSFFGSFSGVFNQYICVNTWLIINNLATEYYGGSRLQSTT